MFDVMQQSLKHFDKYMSSVNPKIPDTYFQNFFSDFDNQGMLLTYFPFTNIPEKDRQKFRESLKWIGWHRDYSGLTGLSKSMYFNSKGDVIKGLSSGLTIKDRLGNEVIAEYADDEMIIQSGDAGFILSGGLLNSTPHTVKTLQPEYDDIMRINFATFMDPRPHKIITPIDGQSMQDVIRNDPTRHNHSTIGKINERAVYRDFIGNAIYKFFN